MSDSDSVRSAGAVLLTARHLQPGISSSSDRVRVRVFSSIDTHHDCPRQNVRDLRDGQDPLRPVVWGRHLRPVGLSLSL